MPLKTATKVGLGALGLFAGARLGYKGGSRIAKVPRGHYVLSKLPAEEADRKLLAAKELAVEQLSKDTYPRRLAAGIYDSGHITEAEVKQGLEELPMSKGAIFRVRGKATGVHSPYGISISDSFPFTDESLNSTVLHEHEHHLGYLTGMPMGRGKFWESSSQAAKLLNDAFNPSGVVKSADSSYLISEGTASTPQLLENLKRRHYGLNWSNREGALSRLNVNDILRSMYGNKYLRTYRENIESFLKSATPEQKDDYAKKLRRAISTLGAIAGVAAGVAETKE